MNANMFIYPGWSIQVKPVNKTSSLAITIKDGKDSSVDIFLAYHLMTNRDKVEFLESLAIGCETEVARLKEVDK